MIENLFTEVVMPSSRVFKQVLPNGLTVLVMPRKTIPKVSTQLWYNVGSKDEKTGEKGIAHLIEHMIFKGTGTLSECDINMITHKLSGSCNAFTSYDYTGYLFDFPSQHWHEALPIMADCMRSSSFKEEFLNSELKAVIQELKMYKDDYASSVIELMISAIFPDHPYHHPIIGYKQDLWSLNRDNLVAFYEHHYVPNNATLVVVGDVEAQEVFEKAHKAFGNIPTAQGYVREQYYHSPDLKNYEVAIYRDITQPIVIVGWIIPGARKAVDYLIDIVSCILGAGKSSRLYKKLVDELELVTELQAFNYDLFDYGVFFIHFQPKNKEDIDTIIAIINQELAQVVASGITQDEVMRAVKKTEVDYLALLENNHKQAYGIGKYFLATGNENYIYTYTDYPKEHLAQEVVDFIGNYLRPSSMHQGKVLPIAERDKPRWHELQDISDQEDSQILAGRTRQAEVEEGKCVYTIEVHQPKPFKFPTSHNLHLSNGLKVLYYDNAYLPKIDIIVDFKAKHYYDPEDLQGLGMFVAHMLNEGTKNYSAIEFANVLDSYGMTLDSNAGQMTLSMLAVDLPKGLELLNEVLSNALFDPQAIEKVRAQMVAEINYYWDSPAQFASVLAREVVYKQHPYHKNSLGTLESIQKITRDDLISFYKANISPKAARMVIVGNLDRYDLKKVLEEMLSTWQGPEVKDLDFSNLETVVAHEINYPIVRDQVVLLYVGLSISRSNPDFDKLLLFDQIFTGGILGSMSSRLFDLRERSGLFYTIGGSLLARVDKQPGMIMVKTIVSNDRLKEAEKAIENVIDTAIDTVTQTEFEEAQRAVVNSLVDNFASNYHIAATLLFKDTYQMPADYFDTRAQTLSAVTLEEMQTTVRKYLNSKKLAKIRIGRI
ncbi:insulinase family protein [Candidatus Dependentiae bacterium]|nr:insulinase family protein [Candidatus Dependentiae bacterium]